MNIKVIKQIKIKSFWHGAISYWALNSLHQDILGKEGYIQKVQTNWIDSMITIPLAIIVIIFVAVDLYAKYKIKALDCKIIIK
jgi:hypothetical protein